MQKVVVAIPGDTAGTWVLSGNGIGMSVYFDLGSGATFRASAGAWVTGNFIGANGAANICATNGGVFAITGVKLEIGAVATPYNRQSMSKSLADCQRYYQTAGSYGGLFSGNVTSGSTYTTFYKFQATMRAGPEIVLANVSATSFPVAVGTPVPLVDGFYESRVANATGAGLFGSSFTASAEL